MDKQLTTQVVREITAKGDRRETTTTTEHVPKKDHVKEMRNGVIYFAISLIMMSAFVFFVLRPLEKDMVAKAHKEYSELLKQSKGLAKDYNEAMETLREMYKQGR